MKYLGTFLVIVGWTAPLAAQEAPPPVWSSTKQLVSERTGAIDSLCDEVAAELNEFRASPEFEAHSRLWADYLKSSMALQAAVAAGKDIDEQKPLRAAVGVSKKSLQEAVDDSRPLGRVNRLLSKCNKLVEAPNPARAALNDSARILREAKLTNDRVADLKQEREKLARRIADARRIVAAQKDPAVRAKNERIVAQAEKQLSDMDQSLMQLEALAATNRNRLQAIGGNDEAATRLTKEFADSLNIWNDAQLRLKDALAAMRQFAEIGPARTLDLTGTVRIRRADGRVLDAATDTPLMLGDVVETGAMSRITLVFEDGSRIVLRENSRFEVALPGASNAVGALNFKQGVQRYVNAFNDGGLRQVVRKVDSNDLERRYRIIRTPVCASAVRGCDMLVFTGDKELRVCIGEGEFILCHRKGEIVPGGHEITVAAGTLETTIRPLVPEAYKKLLRENFPDIE